jgi:hypothetical protein
LYTIIELQKEEGVHVGHRKTKHNSQISDTTY